MAVTDVVLAKITTHSLAILATSDIAAATTWPVLNATIQGWFAAAGIGTESPLLRLFQTPIEAASTVQARARMMGNASGLASQDLRNYEHAVIKVTPRDGAGGWLVDADADGVTNTLPEINLTDRAAVSNCLFTVEYQHSIDR